MSDQNNTRTESPGTWLAELEAHIWAMEPRRLAMLTQLAIEGRLEARFQADAEQIEAAIKRGRPRAISGGVSVIKLQGVLAPVGGLLAMLFDIPNPVDVFKTQLREAVADPEVGAVVVEVDSPGGVVDGIPEAAAEMRALRGGKPIIAHANTMAASAAYWLAAQADEVVAAPSAFVGSIGVFVTHRDLSAAFAEAGIKNTLISAGKFKTEGNAMEPLSDEARAHLQSDVDHFYAMFTADVAKGRGVTPAAVREGYGEGRVLNADAAKAAGLVDRVETVAETVARLGSRSRSGGGARAEDDAPPIEAEADERLAPVAEADPPEPEDDGAEADAGADDEGQQQEGDDESPEALSAEGRAAYRSLLVDLGMQPHDSVVG